MYLKLSYGTIEHTTEFITSNSSYKLEEVYYNNLSHADNSCSVKIPFNVDIQNFINAYSDNSILAQIKETDGTNIFTGYVRKNYDFSKAQKNQALSLELVSPSFLLDVDTTQDITLENTTLDSVVNALLADAEFSTATLTSLSVYNISIFTLDEGSNIKKTLDNLLQQYGFTFDFDKDGNFYVATLFSDIPTDKTTITQIFDGTNSIDEIKVEKKEQEYTGVNLSWTEYKNISNKLIFADTTNGSASENTCSIELEAGKYLTSGNDDDTGTSYYTAYDSSEGDIIYIDSATLILESSNNSGLTYSFTNLGKKGELSIYNKSSSTITITKIVVNGSGYVKGSENQTKTTTGKKFKDITGDYIHDSTNAKKFAQNYCDWQNYADYKISLKSNSDFALGSFAKITEYGLGTLYGRIIDKVYKLNSPIEYKIEAISDYEKAETTDYYTKNYKQGIAGSDGKDGTNGVDGAKGDKGDSGTDSTAITITDPSKTTPETGMTYSNTYYGMYSGQWYMWTWDSSTTGYWTQASATTPPTPAVRYSFDDMPDLPDRSGADYYWDKDLVSLPFNIGINGNPSYIITNGILVISTSSVFNGIYFSCAFNKVLKIKFIVKKGVWWVSLENFPKYYTTGEHEETWSKNNNNGAFVIYNNQDSESEIEIISLYIGDGYTSQPIINNVSGKYNSYSNMAISCAGLNGKGAYVCNKNLIKSIQPTITKGSDFTATCWTDNVNGVVFGTRGNSFSMGYGFVGGKAYFISNNPNFEVYTGTEHTADGNLHLVGVMCRSKKLYQIFDGNISGEYDISSAWNSDIDNSYPLCIGNTFIYDTVGQSSLFKVDDFNLWTSALTASEVLGLYLERATAQKLYTLADYQIANGIASFYMTSNSNTFARNRDTTVSPSSITVNGYKTGSGAGSYSGYYVLKYSTDGGTYIDGATATGTSATLAIPNGTVKFKVEMYSSSSDTTGALTTLSFDVPYNASVKPKYLGLGVLSALSTKAYTAATIAYNSTTDVATITAGSSYSDIITGDWIINYGTAVTQGVYYWNGSAWVLTTDTKYTSDGTIQDIMKLNKLATPITLPDWTVYINLIAKNIFTTNLKILGSGKIFSGEGNYNNSDTPIFLGFDNSVAKFSLGDKLFFDGTNLNLTGIINATGGTFSGLIKQGCNFYIAARIIITYDGSNYIIFSNNNKYKRFIRLNTGRFAIYLPPEDSEYGLPRVITHYCSDMYESTSAPATLDSIADNTYHPYNSNALYQINCRSGLSTSHIEHTGELTNYLPLYFTDNNSDDWRDPVAAIISLIYV